LSEQDEIQEKNELVEILKELKTGLKTLTNDFNRLEGSIVKERIKTVEEALTQNRLLFYAGQLADELDEDITKLVNPECKNRLQCIERFKGMGSETINILKNPNHADALNRMDTEIGKIGDIINKAKGSTCEVCHTNFQKKLRREKRSYQNIVLVERVGSENQQTELNIDRVVETLLEPLANKARLKILVNLCEGKKSFSKLTQLTDLKGGHLIFHLKKLLVAGLIAQEDNKGDYIITQRGLEAAKKVSLLQQA
jgi:DNA-binding transcriptional ArsR family regulator